MKPNMFMPAQFVQVYENHFINYLEAGRRYTKKRRFPRNRKKKKNDSRKPGYFFLGGD